MQSIKKINLYLTINSGQVFLWDKIDDFWYGVIGQEVLRVNEEPFEVISNQKTSNDLFRQGDNL
ncbi:MAG: DNA glycosylase [Nitrososphaerota archaeon]